MSDIISFGTYDTDFLSADAQVCKHLPPLAAVAAYYCLQASRLRTHRRGGARRLSSSVEIITHGDACSFAQGAKESPAAAQGTQERCNEEAKLAADAQLTVHILQHGITDEFLEDTFKKLSYAIEQIQQRNVSSLSFETQ